MNNHYKDLSYEFVNEGGEKWEKNLQLLFRQRLLCLL